MKDVVKVHIGAWTSEKEEAGRAGHRKSRRKNIREEKGQKKDVGAGKGKEVAMRFFNDCGSGESKNRLAKAGAI